MTFIAVVCPAAVQHHQKETMKYLSLLDFWKRTDIKFTHVYLQALGWDTPNTLLKYKTSSILSSILVVVSYKMPINADFIEQLHNIVSLSIMISPPQNLHIN